MKFSSILLGSAALSLAAAFQPTPPPPPPIVARYRPAAPPATRRAMFGGSGTPAGTSSGGGDPAEEAAMAAAAKQLGMPLDEYRIGMKARTRLLEQLSAARCRAGDAGAVAVERDAHNPPQHLAVTITETGKALGADEVGKRLTAALKEAAAESKKKRVEAQTDMMKFIGDEMKLAGKS